MLLHHFEYPVTRFDNVLHGAEFSIDCDSLPERADVRRDEHSDFEAHLLETARYLQGYTTFSVGAGHMHKFEVPDVRISEVLREFEHLLQTQVSSNGGSLATEDAPRKYFGKAVIILLLDSDAGLFYT